MTEKTENRMFEKILKISCICFATLCVVAATYISFENAHQVGVLQQELENVRIEQEKINYTLEHMSLAKDTNVINVYIQQK